MIKTKKDAQQLIDEIRTGETIQYTKEDTNITISYNKEIEKYEVKKDYGHMESNGEYPEITAMYLIFGDRKYINNKTK